MSKTLSLLLEESKSDFTYEIKSISADKLDEQGLYDIYKKLKGCDFLNYVKGKLKDDDLLTFSCGKDSYGMFISQGFNNKKVTLDFRWAQNDEIHDKNGWNGKRVMGIQIKDYDYRFVYGVPYDDKNPETNYDAVFNQICAVTCDSKGWLDKDYSKHPGKLFNDENLKTSLKITKGNVYNKYGGANRLQTFIYQYYNLPGKSSKNKNEDLLTYDKLYNRIKSDLLKAEEIIKKMPILNK